MSLQEEDVRKLLKRTSAHQHKKDGSGNGDEQEQPALLIQVCLESMNKDTCSPGIPTSTTPLLSTNQESTGLRQNMRTLQQEKFLEPNLFFKDAYSVTKDIGLENFQDPDRNSDYSTKTKGALKALHKILAAKIPPTLKLDPYGKCVRLRIYQTGCKGGGKHTDNLRPGAMSMCLLTRSHIFSGILVCRQRR